MLSSELKKDVQDLWNAFWAGGIANPLTAIEQITYLIYLKQIEDLGNYPAFFTNAEEPDGTIVEGNLFRWSVIRHMPNEQALRHLKTKVFERLRAMENGGRMNGAELLINSPNLLGMAIKIIDNIFVSSRNQDTLGDIYELLLREIAVAGKNGQFRTPRQIIRLMCDLVDPRFGERVCDPAAGTGGFLVNAFQHMLKRQQARDNIEFEANGTPIKLTKEDDEQYERLRQGDMFVGYDFDQTMVRLGWMNLTLHGIKKPQLDYGDTLNRSFDTQVLNKDDFDPFNVILANPPFTGNINRGDIAESLALELSTDKTALLFVERIYQMLAKDGRAAIILPEGVLFGSTNAHKKLRKKLLTKTHIKAIISLPGGVFQPYTGVKTSILIFQKGGTTDKVWFYELAQDGQTLDAKRIERPYYNDSWDLTVRYAARYHIDPPAFVHPKRTQEWDRWRAMDDDKRRQSYILPLFVQNDRLDENGYSVWPTTLEMAQERYRDQAHADDEITAIVQYRMQAAERAARIKALMALRKGRGDRQKAARNAAQKYLRDAARTIRAAFETAAQGILLTTGEQQHGLKELMAVIDTEMGDIQSWVEAATTEITDALRDTLDDMQDLNQALADAEHIETIDLAFLIAPFRFLDGTDKETFGRLRLLTPELRKECEENSGRLSGPFVPALPKEWEIPVTELATNDNNMSAGRYKPFSLIPTIHEPPAEIIRHLQSLEGRIQDGLATLLSMVKERA
jgi:type I restriction enzyme M protein